MENTIKKISDAVDRLDQVQGGVTLIKNFLEWKGISMDSEVAPRLFTDDEVGNIGETLNTLSDKLTLVSTDYAEWKKMLASIERVLIQLKPLSKSLINKSEGHNIDLIINELNQALGNK